MGFTIICLVALLLDQITNGRSNYLYFTVYRSSLADPKTYVRLIGHVFGHANMEHFMGNIMFILLVGPMLEEKYGHRLILEVIAITAIVTGLVHSLFYSQVGLLGASGVVFAFILLSSFTKTKDGGIPVTFLLVAFLYIGREVVNGIWHQSNVSNLTHIIGGVIGAIIGYQINKIHSRKGSH